MSPRTLPRLIVNGLLVCDVSLVDKFWLIALLYSHLASIAGVSMIPKLNNSPEHVTVVESGRVILPCTVESRGEQSVIWVNPRKTLISLADQRMIDDHRISVERPYIKIWNLLIRDVRYNDSGTYECRVNTSPIQVKKVTLEVQVPPAIISQLSSDKVVLEEGQTATLICNVTGIPPPNVTWYKRNYRTAGNAKERIGLEGEVLMIHNITRLCDDIYECFVDNGVPPAVSKAIRVVVDYAPEVIVPNPKGIGQQIGKETILECQIFAHPQAVTSWMKNGRLLNKNNKYDIDVFKNDLENSVTLALRIRDLEPSDYGHYTCTGSNFLGEDSETMLLYEIRPPPTTTTATTPMKTQGLLTSAEKTVNPTLVYIEDINRHSNHFNGASDGRGAHNGHRGLDRETGGRVYQPQHALQESPATSSFNSELSQGRPSISDGNHKNGFHSEEMGNAASCVSLAGWKALCLAVVWTLKQLHTEALVTSG